MRQDYLSSEDLYTNPTPPNKCLRTSTPEEVDREPEKEPIRCPLKEIINHRPALHIPPVELIVAPGQQAGNVQRGLQRVQAMAGRGRNANQGLQGADPALVQILQMMQNRDVNRDISHKQFLMFPKESFTGEDKKKAQSHWAEFYKYLHYQNQQGTIPRTQANLPEIKSMFKLTLQDIALEWFETESPNWLTKDQMKQAFLKRFNPWGDTRCQQQDAWNKLKFDMNKYNVDAFVINMKMLASILGHNDEATMEKFKDIFPDLNIEAALIAMDDFTAMQTKAKQLVQIYKPTHDNPMASATILAHTTGDAGTKSQKSQPKSHQHQLAPINSTQEHVHRGVNITWGNRDEGVDMIMAHGAVEMEETLKIDMIIKIKEEAIMTPKEIFMITEVEVKKIHSEGDEGNGMVTTLTTVTGTIGIETMKVKVMQTEVENGKVIEVRDTVIKGEEENGIMINNISNHDTHKTTNIPIPIITAHHL